MSRRCPKCQQAITTPHCPSPICPNLPIQKLIALHDLTAPIRQLIYNHKTQPEAQHHVAHKLIQYLQTNTHPNTYDLIIAIPSTTGRTHNQNVLTHTASRLPHWPIQPNALTTTKTIPRTRKPNETQRRIRANLHAANIKYPPAHQKQKRILLYDDVATTLHTINAIATNLAPATITGIVIARALYNGCCPLPHQAEPACRKPPASDSRETPGHELPD